MDKRKEENPTNWGLSIGIVGVLFLVSPLLLPGALHARIKKEADTEFVVWVLVSTLMWMWTLDQAVSLING